MMVCSGFLLPSGNSACARFLLPVHVRDLGSDISCAYMTEAGNNGAHASLRNTNRWLSGSSSAARSSNRSAYTADQCHCLPH